MTWYFNFCAPAIPNDATINFHRGFQTAELMTLLILFVLYHTYYKLCGPDPLSETNDEELGSNESQSKKDSQEDKSEKSNSDEKSVNDNDEDKSENQENKSVSIVQKIRDGAEENESYVSFKTSGNKILKNKKQAANAQKKPSEALSIKQNVSAQQIEQYFPIVFGHHAIAMGASIMYSPYAEQSIASILYVLFTFLLAIVNSKRMRNCTFAVWICKILVILVMAFLNVFIMMSSLLQVGQSNWDFVNNVCFAEEYVSLY